MSDLVPHGGDLPDRGLKALLFAGWLLHQTELFRPTADWAHAPPGLPANWMSGMFNTVFFGWQSFSSAANDVWMDDLVLSNARINCTP